MAIQRPEGTEDLLPADLAFYHGFIKTAFQVFGTYGYAPIETPLFEQTDLFVRGIGESSDVVSKEMFTAISDANMQKVLAGETLRAKSRLSLRPEGTAGTVRAIAQAALVGPGTAPVKFSYAGPMFRAERPQKGRLRQFHQIGVECMGADAPSIDAEGIIMLMRFYERIGIPMDKTHLLLNSMGDATCRPAYCEAVRAYIFAHEEAMCDDCRRRVQINPLRAFDCKEPGCQVVMARAPKVTDMLCNDCRLHYAQVKAYLDAAGIAYEEDPTLVRGLDYYTRTVFEIQVDLDGMGANAAIGGGGRYDGLMQKIAGKPASGFGFAIGYERCKLALEAVGIKASAQPTCDVFIACVDDSTRPAAFDLVQQCRDAGVRAEIDHQGRSLKSQFKLADKLGARKVAVLGPDEAAQRVVNLRDMKTHKEELVAQAELPSLF